MTLKNEKGEDIDVSTLAAAKGVVFFLVPKADTRELNILSDFTITLTIIYTAGCTTQACGFRDVYPDFTSVNYEVYCLSADTPAAQTKWQTKASYTPLSDDVLWLELKMTSVLQKELPYPLLSDPKRTLIGALGAADGAKTKRSHFVFSKGGKLLDKKMPVKPVDRYVVIVHKPSNI